MTAQATEKLLLNGNELPMRSEPLSTYLYDSEYFFMRPHTGLSRGYIGTWEIQDKKLYLVDLKGNLHRRIKGFNSETVKGNPMNVIFPDADRVFAAWYTATARVWIGEQLLYVHRGFSSVYEKDLILQFEDGCLISKEEIDNREKYNELSCNYPVK